MKMIKFKSIQFRLFTQKTNKLRAAWEFFKFSLIDALNQSELMVNKLGKIYCDMCECELTCKERVTCILNKRGFNRGILAHYCVKCFEELVQRG